MKSFSGVALHFSSVTILVKHEQKHDAIFLMLSVICPFIAKVLATEEVSFVRKIRFKAGQNRFGSFTDSFRRFRLFVSCRVTEYRILINRLLIIFSYSVHVRVENF